MLPTQEIPMKTTVILTTILVGGVLCVAASAQDTKKKAAAPPAGAMAMAKPAPEMKALRALIGTWTTDEAYEASPMGPAGTGSGTNTVRLGPGGFSVLVEQRSKGSMGAFAGHGVYSWDPEQKAYKAAWVDSMTPGLTTQAGHMEGENLVFTGEATVAGKKISMRDVWSDFTPTSHLLTSYNNDGSGEKKMMTIKFIKQEPPPAPAKK
jgi:uncharacterized protein (DUF2147 family)